METDIVKIIEKRMEEKEKLAKDIKKSKNILLRLRIQNILLTVGVFYLSLQGYKILSLLPAAVLVMGVIFEYLLYRTIKEVEK